MLHIAHDRTLKSYTTFKIGGPAREFVEVSTPAELKEALDYADSHSLNVLVLGGGSNMLVSDSGYDGLVIHLLNRGIDIMEGEETLLRAASGEVWDDVVRFAVERELWGIENLSRIPGQAGAFAVQNVGAYGREANDVIVSVDVFDRTDGTFKTLTNPDCGFSYRKSIFNTTDRGRYVILSTTIRLSREPMRVLNYPDLQKVFASNPFPSIREIREAIIKIRDTKFPFPAESIEGNAGSFFKNSLLDGDEYRALEATIARVLPDSLERLKSIAKRSSEQTRIKIPTAFILEISGLKGFGHGNVQLNPTQPVILLNKTANATAKEVLQLVAEVRAIVKTKTGLSLQTEPEMIGFTDQELSSAGFPTAPASNSPAFSRRGPGGG